MRITVADKIDPELACQLANKLNLACISLTKSHHSATLPSDDEDIDWINDQINSEITKIHSTDMTTNGFFLNNYPQNVIQAQSLDMSLARRGQPLSIALMSKSARNSQNREKSALIRYYRSQNKLILIDEPLNIEELCKTIHTLYNKRRS